MIATRIVNIPNPGREVRLECLKLAVQWGERRYASGYSAIGDSDVIERAALYYAFCDSGSDPQGGDGTAVECEASQSGAESASPDLVSKAGALVGKLA